MKDSLDLFHVHVDFRVVSAILFPYEKAFYKDLNNV